MSDPLLHREHGREPLQASSSDGANPIGCKVLLACSSTSTPTSQDLGHIARDLREPAMLAVPSGIRVAYEGLSCFLVQLSDFLCQETRT